MAGLLVAIAVMGVTLSMVMPTWSTGAKREKEAELIFRGEQYMRAIELYQRRFAGAYPTDMQLLIDQRFLRKAFTDPMTGGEFEILTQASLQATPSQAPPETAMRGVTPADQDRRTGASPLFTKAAMRFSPPFYRQAAISRKSPSNRAGAFSAASPVRRRRNLYAMANAGRASGSTWRATPTRRKLAELVIAQGGLVAEELILGANKKSNAMTADIKAAEKIAFDLLGGEAANLSVAEADAGVR